MRHLLSVTDLDAAAATSLLDTADRLRQALLGREVRKLPTLRGRTVITMFYENSTRTRVSFEIAGKWMSADTVNVSASGSSVGKGESLRDTSLTLSAMGADCVIIRHPPAQPHPVLPVDLDELHHDLVVARSGHVLAHVVGADRELPVAAVDQHGQLDRARTAVFGQRVQRRAHRAPGHQHVVDQHDQRVVHAALGHLGGTERPGRLAAQVIAVQRGVDRSDGDRGTRPAAGELRDRRSQPPGQHRSSRRDADQHHVLGVGCLLDDLVRDPRDGAGDVGRAEQLPIGSALSVLVPAAGVRHERLLSRLTGRGLKEPSTDSGAEPVGRTYQCGSAVGRSPVPTRCPNRPR